jgi:ADP-dependent NAD(P)H-hydrate dehydratase / NAD(P)H-hydrate epimerase
LTLLQPSPYHRAVHPVITSAQMREIDRLTSERYGIPSLVLMENAASAVVRVIVSTFAGDVAGKTALVLCGRGNNGGDGAAAGRLLAHAGANVFALLFGKIDDTKGDARTNFEALESLGSSSETVPGSIRFVECGTDDNAVKVAVEHLSPSVDVIVDGLFGTGLSRPLEGAYAEVVGRLNKLKESATASPLIVAIDVPSGLNSDDPGLIGPAIQADITVTMTAPKPANVLSPASNLNGRLIVADIGSPSELLAETKADLFLTDENDARRWLTATRYTPQSHKNTHGHALIVAGSRGLTGAATLCANAAMRAGAGLVTVASTVSAQPLVAAQVMPEVMTTGLAETDRGTVSDDAFDYFAKFSERADVVAIGPGLSSEDERTRAFVRKVLERRRTPVVIDADGLNCLSPWPDELRGSSELPIVLTPHPGEMLRLLDASDKSAVKDRVEAARQFATQHGVILLLKGGRSLVAASDGRVFLNSTGNAGLGTAGAGDTLTGVVTGFLAQAQGCRTANGNERVQVLDTVIAALYVSGLAGDLAARERGMRTMVASDIREHLSAAICSLDPRGEYP